MSLIKVTSNRTDVRPEGPRQSVTELLGFHVGQKVKIKGERGDFNVTDLVVDRSSQAPLWATLYGGTAGNGAFRSVALDRLKRTRKGTS